MTALGWLALAWAAVLVPTPETAPVRARALAGRETHARAWPMVRRPGASVLIAVVTTCGVIGVTLERGPVLGVATAVLGLTASRLAADTRTRRRRQRGERDLLAAVRLLVAEVESGARPEAALGAAAGAAPEHAVTLREAARAAGDGEDAAAVLLEDPALTSLGQAWQLAGVAGVPLADVLSGVARDLASRVEQGRAVGVALSAARSTAALLAGLPLLGIGLGAAMGARPLTFLTQSAAGRLVCCGGVVLDALGLLWTQRIAHRAESS
jgi:tight adherence protein B